MQNRKQFSKKEIEILWNELEECHCGHSNCYPNTHRLCRWCKKIILKCAYVEKQPNSFFIWNVDQTEHIKKGETNKIEYLRILCMDCYEEKDFE